MGQYLAAEQAIRVIICFASLAQLKTAERLIKGAVFDFIFRRGSRVVGFGCQQAFSVIRHPVKCGGEYLSAQRFDELQLAISKGNAAVTSRTVKLFGFFNCSFRHHL